MVVVILVTSWWVWSVHSGEVPFTTPARAPASHTHYRFTHLAQCSVMGEPLAKISSFSYLSIDDIVGHGPELLFGLVHRHCVRTSSRALVGEQHAAVTFSDALRFFWGAVTTASPLEVWLHADINPLVDPILHIAVSFTSFVCQLTVQLGWQLLGTRMLTS